MHHLLRDTDRRREGQVTALAARATRLLVGFVRANAGVWFVVGNLLLLLLLGGVVGVLLRRILLVGGLGWLDTNPSKGWIRTGGRISSVTCCINYVIYLLIGGFVVVVVHFD